MTSFLCCHVYFSLLFVRLEEIKIKIESRLHCIRIYDDDILLNLSEVIPLKTTVVDHMPSLDCGRTVVLLVANPGINELPLNAKLWISRSGSVD